MSRTFRTAYEQRTRKGLSFEKEKSRTHQSFKKECDVNHIMAKYRATGVLPDLIRSNPRYGDFSDVPSYQDSMNRVLFANEQFAALPALVRKRFGNDPAEFLAFASDPKNSDELVSLGLAEKRRKTDSPASGGVSNPESKPSETAPGSAAAPKG